LLAEAEAVCGLCVGGWRASCALGRPKGEKRPRDKPEKESSAGRLEEEGWQIVRGRSRGRGATGCRRQSVARTVHRLHTLPSAVQRACLQLEALASQPLGVSVGRRKGWSSFSFAAAFWPPQRQSGRRKCRAQRACQRGGAAERAATSTARQLHRAENETQRQALLEAACGW